jgi:hypothetical protein
VSLPWVRLDSNIASHDKTLWLVQQRGGHRALAVYCLALGWSGGHATDGHIPTYALPALHATRADATLLETAGLWEPSDTGWRIHNYAQRQETRAVSEAKHQQQSDAGRKSACIRNHGPNCGCWNERP